MRILYGMAERRMPNQKMRFESMEWGPIDLILDPLDPTGGSHRCHVNVTPSMELKFELLLDKNSHGGGHDPSTVSYLRGILEVLKADRPMRLSTVMNLVADDDMSWSPHPSEDQKLIRFFLDYLGSAKGCFDLAEFKRYSCLKYKPLGYDDPRVAALRDKMAKSSFSPMLYDSSKAEHGLWSLSATFLGGNSDGRGMQLVESSLYGGCYTVLLVEYIDSKL